MFKREGGRAVKKRRKSILMPRLLRFTFCFLLFVAQLAPSLPFSFAAPFPDPRYPRQTRQLRPDRTRQTDQTAPLRLERADSSDETTPLRLRRPDSSDSSDQTAQTRQLRRDSSDETTQT